MWLMAMKRWLKGPKLTNTEGVQKMRNSTIIIAIGTLASLLTFVKDVVALDVQWATSASDPTYLLSPENLTNSGGIEYSWYGQPLNKPGQRDLNSFRQEMIKPGRCGGGINWEGLQGGTEIANSTGVPIDVVGLPNPVRIIGTTSGNPLKVAAPSGSPVTPTSGLSWIGTSQDGGWLSAYDQLTFELHPSSDLKLHGFGIVLVDSGWDNGGATISFFGGETLLDRFPPEDGVLFHDFSTDDNFVGYWSETPITKVHIEADAHVLRGRFDDIGLVFVPEPATLSLLGLGSLVFFRRRRQRGKTDTYNPSRGNIVSKAKDERLRSTVVTIAIVAAVSGFLTYVPQVQGSLLVANSKNSIYGYGKSYCKAMTAALNTATKNEITVAANLEDLDQMLSFDTLWVDVRFDLPRTLSDVEVENIKTFVSTGRRAVIMGENNVYFRDWNAQLMDILGGINTRKSTSGSSTTLLAHELTAEVNNVTVSAAGLIQGGVPLFDKNWATLWHNNNVLTLLDVNFMTDESWNIGDNGRFVTNIANWIAVPEPTTILMLAFGCLVMKRYRRL